jgi:nucleoside-diphosphate-sugar epimerase
MHIAITGGTGFLGRYLVRELAEAGHELRCWYRPSSDRSGLDDCAGRIDWQQGDLGDADAARALVQGVDAVVHAALQWERSTTDGRRTSGDGNLMEFLEKNLMGSLRLFHEARSAGVKRFVFIATCAVHEVILDDRPLDETHPLWPTKHYGAHKAALEKFVHSYGLGQGWPICSLRPTGIYGVAHPVSASRWFDLVGRVLRGEAIRTERGGKEVHARDVARAVTLLLNAEEKRIAGRAFNCYDCYVAEQKVAQLAKKITGSKSEIADLNRGPKHQIETGALRSLGMTFGGEALLEETVAQLVRAHS